MIHYRPRPPNDQLFDHGLSWNCPGCFDESSLFYTCTYLVPGRMKRLTPGTCCKWKSTKHRVQNQRGSNLAFSQFVSSSPSRLFVFFSQSLPQPLVSSSAGQSVSSEVFISTAGLPVCRKDKQLFKCLCSFRSLPPHLHLPAPFFSPKMSPLPLAALGSRVSFNLPPLLILFQALVSPLCTLLPINQPFSCSSAGYLGTEGIVLSRTSCCSDLVRNQSDM